MYDHLHPKRWGDITQEERNSIQNKTAAVLKAVMQTPNKMIPYDFINKAGLEHLYRFLVEAWNDNHPGKIDILEKGVIYRP